MNYYKFIITTDEATGEILTAFLSQQPFDVFEPTDMGLNAYIPEKDYNSAIDDAIVDLSSKFTFEWEKEFIAHQNWNAVWESNFEPIQIDDFCGIRASFHPPFKAVEHEIVIDPKMAFGTGHHETTYMVMQVMRTIDFEGKEVFDFGCGTGILAILADFLKAKYVFGIDYDPLSVENTKENISINQTSTVEVSLGEIDSVKRDNWDVILANINRHVILNSLETLYKKVKIGGQLIISGLMRKDEALITEKVEQMGFEILAIKRRNDWICFQLTR